MSKQKTLDKQIEVGHWGTIVKPKLEVIKKFAGKSILDVGCSTGDYVYHLNQLGYETYGCDLEKDKKWKKDPARFKVADITKLPYNKKSFDTVIAFEIFEHLENPSLALKSLKQVAKKNIIISVPNCELPSVFNHAGVSFYHHIDKTHVNRFTEDEIKKILRINGFKIDYFKAISPIRPEILFYYTWRIPLSLAVLIGKVVSKFPFRRNIYSDLLIVASI